MPDLRSYQLQAVENWENNGFCGLFAMATGTGKTITSLSCAKSLQRREGLLSLFVLVPTLDLANQWKDEIKSFLGLGNIIIANSESKDWYKESIFALNSGLSFCIVTTYATFLTSRFKDIIDKASEKSFLIADEVHNFGTKRHILGYPEHIKRRLGLSATPDRYYDDEGSLEIYKYFKAEERFTFEFSMSQAIDEKFLCEYYYYPILVTLTEEELNEYREISIKLNKFFNLENGAFADSKIVSALLLKRKRVIHQAVGKLDALRVILKELISKKANIMHLLVYVPEGNDDKIYSEDKKLINSYSRIIAEEFGLTQHQFIGETLGRKKILDDFANGKTAVLTAMKCLDEGVDIKQASTAIFCSSTGNPKQFIQRRGRILRTHESKKYATIYDMIVVPALKSQYFESTLQMEKNILQGELKRVHEFASLSRNHYQALSILEDVATQFNLDIYSNTDI